MSTKISTLLAKVDFLHNRKNAAIILDFYKYMLDRGSSENHIINNLKIVLDLACFLGFQGYESIKKREEIFCLVMFGDT
jgi:hypothetical protein